VERLAEVQHDEARRRRPIVEPTLRAFQSNATLIAFSTASAPPAIQKWYGNPAGVTCVANVSTNSAM
jgi:hypothetical protein